MAAKFKAKSRAASNPAPAAGDSFFANLPFAQQQKLIRALQVIAIVFGALWVFSPVLDNTWYSDDTLYITMNPLLHEPGRLWKAWFAPGSFVDYYPIEQTVQWAQWNLFGQGSPFGYLVCNLLLHIASALLLWRLFARLGLRYAWLGGLLFAIYPLLVDSVGNAAELKNTLSLPPLLLAMTAYLDFDQSRRPRDYALALGLYLVAMLCKITAFFFPIILLLYAWWRRGKITRADVFAAVPFFLIAGTLCLLDVHALGLYESTHESVPGPIHLGGFWNRIELAGLCLAFYFGHAFLPLHPVPYYPLWTLDPLTPLAFLPWLGVALVLGCCWIKRRTWGRPVLFALAFFALGLAPFLGFNEVSYMCLAWVFDHFLYLPVIALIGLAVAAVDGIGHQLPGRLRHGALALLTLLVVLLGLETRSYATLFADQEQLWRYNLQYTPNSWMVHHLLASELDQNDRRPEAIAEERESLRLNPDFDNAQMALGVFLVKTGDLSGAIAAFRRCLEINPHYQAARLFLGLALTRDGRPADAVVQLRSFLQAIPHSAQGHMGLAQALAAQGHIPEAIAELQTALQLNPGDDQIQSQIAALQARLH